MALREHLSLSASTAASVQVTGLDDVESTFEGVYGDVTRRMKRPLRRVTVVNHNPDAAVYYTLNGDAPVVEADDMWVLPPGAAWTHEYGSATSVMVRLISEDAGDISVIGEA